MEDQNRADSVDDERPGTVIGRYTIVRKLGEGGFGAVFLAEQSEPVRRQVALKIIKLGMDTRDVIARFEQERQALALMDHPHIAKVLDAGATATGRPYFVMELVEGVPITEYCDENRLTVAERLEVMFDVCQAVQHAHAKGLIHRDLKPSNVLVATRDGRPHPKVIDFGVAKATSKLTERTLLTEEFQMIGTPLYMSPEQAAGSLDIDTRTDVYSLGVLLYEVLTSATPVGAETLREAMYHEVQRIIREVDPPKPSTRVVSGRPPISELASARRTEPARLASVLRGELDWIVMKALEKDRAHRYGTASELAQDIRRHLAGEPVEAAPASRSYRVTKFIRRNKGKVAAGAAVFLALVVGLVGTLWQARAAERQRARADEARADAEKIADFQSSALRRVDPSEMGRDLFADLRSRVDETRARRGEKESDRAAALTSFDALFAGVNATDAARRIMDANILKPASEAVAEKFGAEPLLEARLREALAETYSSLGLSDKALPEAERRLAVLAGKLGPSDRETLVAQTDLGSVYFALGRFEECEAEYDAASREYAARFPAGDPGARQLRQCIGVLELKTGQNDEAKRLFEELTAEAEREHGPDSVEVAEVVSNLAKACLNLENVEGAVPHLERAHRIYAARLGPTDPKTLDARQSLARRYETIGRREDAVATQIETIATLERTKGEKHPATAAAIAALAQIYRTQARFTDAETQAEKALALQRAVLGDAHPATLESLRTLAAVLSSQNRHDEAERLCEEALALSETLYGLSSPITMEAVNSLGAERWFRGRFEPAKDLFERVIAYHDSSGAEGVVPAAEVRRNLANVYMALGRLEEAEAPLDRSIADLTARLGPEHRATLDSRALRATLFNMRNDCERAADEFTAVIAARRKICPADDPELLKSLYNLALAYKRLGRLAEAEPLLRETLDGRRRTIGPNHPFTLETLAFLKFVLANTGRSSETRPLVEELLAARRAVANSPNATSRQKCAYATSLVTIEFEDLRDPAEAIRFATAASEEAGGADPMLLDALAFALHAAGRSAEAAAAQRRALEFLPPQAPEREEYEGRLAEYEAKPSK